MNTSLTENKNRIPVINKAWCKGCQICVAFCPTDALSMDAIDKAELAYPERCNGCGLCALRCPDLAIELQ